MLPARFELIRQISSGGLYDTFLALDRVTSRQVLVKRPAEISNISIEERNALLRKSYSILKLLKHRGIVMPCALVEEGGRSHVAYPYYDEQRWVSLSPELFLEHYRTLLVQMCTILDFVHAMGFVHSDIKKANWLCLRRESGLRVLLTDFDFAVRSGSKPNRRIFGSLGFMAPEVLRDEIVLPQSDHFSFGRMLFELVSHATPKEELSLPNILTSGLEEQQITGDQVRAGFEPLVPFINKLLKKHYEDRPSSLGVQLQTEQSFLGVQLSTYQNRLIQDVVAAHLRRRRQEEEAAEESLERYLPREAGIFGIPSELLLDLFNLAEMNFFGKARIFAGWLADSAVNRHGSCWHVEITVRLVGDFYRRFKILGEPTVDPANGVEQWKRIRRALRFKVKNQFLKAAALLSPIVQAVRMSDSVASRKLLAQLLLKMGESLQFANMRAEGKKCFREAWELGELSDLRRIRLMLEEADLESFSHGGMSYRKVLMQAYALAQRRERSDLRACVLIRQIWLDHTEGRQYVALQRAKTLERFCARHNLYTRRASALSGMGSIYWILGRLQDAVDVFQEGLRANPEQVSRGVRNILAANLGALQHDLGDYRKVVNTLLPFTRQSLSINEVQYRSQALANIQAAYAFQGKYDLAEDMSNQEFWLPSQRSDLGGIGRYYIGRGSTLLRAGRYHDAESNLRQSVELLSSLSNTALLGRAEMYLATLRTWQGHYEVARQHLSSARTLINLNSDKLHSLDLDILSLAIEFDEGVSDSISERLKRLYQECLGLPYYLGAAYCLYYLVYVGRPFDAVRLAATSAELMKYMTGSGGVFGAAVAQHLRAYTESEPSQDGVDIGELKKAFVMYENAHLYFYSITVARQVAEYYKRHGHPKLADKFIEEALFHADQLDNTRLKSQLEAARLDILGEIGEPIPERDVLYRISTLLGGLTDYRPAVEQLLHYAIDLTGAERGAIILADDEGRNLRVESSYECDSQSVADIVAISRNVIRSVFDKAKVLFVENALDDKATKSYKSVVMHNILSIACAPLVVEGKVIGALYLDHHSLPGLFTSDDRETVEAIANFIAVALLQARLVRSLRNQNLDHQYLLRNQGIENQFLTRSRTTLDIIDKIPMIASSEACVLLLGESGTGKEILAKSIHDQSPRKDGPFVRLNCASLGGEMLEANLFGVEKGVATGVASREGVLQAADGGTLFLDEIGDMPLTTQAKLLRVLELKQFEKLGTNKTIETDIRLVAATNKDLNKLIDQNQFRADLMYRINTIEIKIPPLRERPDDVKLLLDHFADVFARGRKVTFTSTATAALTRYSWPGNVRELRNFVENASVMSKSRVVDIDALPDEISKNYVNTMSLGIRSLTAEAEKQLIEKVLAKNNWNQAAAARELGLSYATLQRKIKKYGIKRPDDNSFN